MTQIIKHIDAIALEKQAGVLFMEFHWFNLGLSMFGCLDYDYKRDELRQRIINQLNQWIILWQPCKTITKTEYWIPYLGQIYLDLPADESNPKYRILKYIVQTPEGTPRYKSIRFSYLPLNIAIGNAEK